MATASERPRRQRFIFLFVEETLAATLIDSLKPSLTLKLALCVGFQSYYCHGGSLQDNKRAGGRLFSIVSFVASKSHERTRSDDKLILPNVSGGAKGQG